MSNENDSRDKRSAPKDRAVAVALEYDYTKDDAPKVVASGKGKLAEQILSLAFEQGVKVREDADLAQMLSAIDVDTEIPLEAFAAVAEILAYVYRFNGEGPPNPHEILADFPVGIGQEDRNNEPEQP